MADFFNSVFDEFLTPVFLENVRIKFHFWESQRSGLWAAAEEMLPLMRRDAFWERKGFVMEKGRQGKEFPDQYESVVMSLGRGIDSLQESYNERGLLLQSYMIEILAGEILLKGYEAYAQYMKNETGWYVVRYHFPGSGEIFPIEMLPELLQEYAPRITCNSYFYMIPSKSVVFISELTRNEKIQCESICTECSYIQCPNRMSKDK